MISGFNQHYHAPLPWNGIAACNRHPMRMYALLSSKYLKRGLLKLISLQQLAILRNTLQCPRLDRKASHRPQNVRTARNTLQCASLVRPQALQHDARPQCTALLLLRPQRLAQVAKIRNTLAQPIMPRNAPA